MTALLKLLDIKTLVAGLFPVILGSVYSFYRYDKFSFMHLMLLLIGISFMQGCANMINDIYDLKRGADTDARAEEKVLVSGEASLRQVKMIVYVFLTVATAILVYYATTIHLAILFVGLFGTTVMYFYSAGKRPISYTCFGEITDGFTMGLCIMTTVIYIQSEVVNMETIFVTIPTSILIGTILLTNNLSDHKEDKIAGRRTLPILLGVEFAEWLWVLSCSSLILLTITFVCLAYWPILNLILVIMFFPYAAIIEFRKLEKKAMNKPHLMTLIGKIGIRYHGALILGFLLS